jgi:plastocyanin
LSEQQDKGPPAIIHMTDQLKFIPDRLTVRVGQTVEWINDAEAGGASHAVTTDPEKVMDPKHVSRPAGAEVFDSGNIKPGKSFTYVFKVPGLYKYACPPHEGMMRGEITVEP